MDRDYIIIEDRQLPKDRYANFNNQINTVRKGSGGFLNFTFLCSLVATCVLWTLLFISLGK